MKKALLIFTSTIALNASTLPSEVVARPSLASRIWRALTSCATAQNIDRTLEYLDSAAQAAAAVTAVVAPSAADEVKYVASLVHGASVAYDPPKTCAAGTGITAGSTAIKDTTKTSS